MTDTSKSAINAACVRAGIAARGFPDPIDTANVIKLVWALDAKRDALTTGIETLKKFSRFLLDDDAVGVMAMILNNDSLTALTALTTYAASEVAAKPQPFDLDTYDAGLMPEINAGWDWWQKYVRAELGRAHDFYQAQVQSGEE